MPKTTTQIQPKPKLPALLKTNRMQTKVQYEQDARTLKVKVVLHKYVDPEFRFVLHRVGQPCTYGCTSAKES